MRLFYPLAFLLTIGVTFGALWLLPSQWKAWPGEIVQYNTYGAKIRSLDPATCGDTASASVQGNFYEGLYTYHYLKRPVEVIGQLAEDMPTVSADGKTYTIKLKKGVLYCRNECFGQEPDGRSKTREVKAADFVLAFKRIADYHLVTPMSYAFIEDKIAGITDYHDKTRTYEKGDFSRYDLPFDGVKAIDDYTLQINLVTPFPQLIYVLAVNNYAPIPRELIDYWLATRPAREGTGREEIPMRERAVSIFDYRAAVGTGPYYLVQFTQNGDIVMRRNADFRDERYPSDGSPGDKEAGLLADAGKRVPFIDVQHWTYVAEDNPSWLLFLSNQADVSGIPRQMYSQVISPGKKLTDEWAKKGITLLTYSDPAVYWLAFNMEDKALGASKSLRQALCLAFDVEKYIEVLHNGRGIRAVNTLPSSFKGWQEAGPGPYAKYDLAAAGEKLKAARRELVKAGVIASEDAPLPEFTLDLGGRDEEDRRMGEFIKKEFAKVGVNVKVELNDWPTLQQKVENKRTQLYAMGWHADYPDAENFLQNYYTPNIKRGTNNTNYSNPQFDKLYEQAAIMQDTPERTRIYAQMVNMLSEDCPVLLLSEPVSFVLYHDWVHNVKRHPIGYGMTRFVRIDQPAQLKARGD